MITKKQKIVLKAINDFIIKHNYSPSVRELALILNLKSSSSVQAYLDRLQEKGYIERNERMSRSIHVIKYQED